MSLTSFFKTLGHDIKQVAIKVASVFTAIFGSKAAEDFGKAALALLKSDLGAIVLDEVEALANVNNLTGAEKFVQAQTAILEKVKALGISATTSIINMLIEVAVQFVKGNLTAVSAATTTTTTT